jgi:hypothetical protein
VTKCRDCDNEVFTNFANLCKSCHQNPNSRTSQFSESNKEQDDNLNRVKQRYQCGICNEHASHVFGNNFRILQHNNPLFELLRCEACGYACGTCSAKADPELGRNKQVFIRDFDWKYLHCGHCNHEIQLACTRCNNNHLFSLNKLMQNDFPPTIAECVNCAKILKWESNLSRTSTILSKYHPDNKFTTKIPMVVEYMKEDIGFIDNWSKRRDIWLNEENQRKIVKSNLIKTTIKIPQYEATYKKSNKYDKVKSMYYRCWQSYLADYEKYLKKKYILVRIEIDTWKKTSSTNSRYPSIFNYPIIIHYHLSPINRQN